MIETIDLGEFAVEVVRKDIKNIHLGVYPPIGKVRISAPQHMNLGTIRVFAISRLDWIKRHQCVMREQERETPREYVDRESHYVWGKRYLLRVVEMDMAPNVKMEHATILLRVRPKTDENKKRSIIAEWYREEVREAVPSLIAKWESLIGVNVRRIFVQHMKTKWGSCNHTAGSIRLNSELAKKPRECLEYVLVHEMVHLLEPGHNKRFNAHIDHFMPQWRLYRDELNRAPLSHENWDY
jgi:hypothetical protein